MVATKDSRTNQSAELDKAADQKKMLESLHANFMKKYQEEIKLAQEY